MASRGRLPGMTLKTQEEKGVEVQERTVLRHCPGLLQGSPLKADPMSDAPGGSQHHPERALTQTLTPTRAWPLWPWGTHLCLAGPPRKWSLAAAVRH